MSEFHHNFMALETPVRIEDEDGEAFTMISYFHVDRETTDEEVKEWVADNFPSRHCQHSYDCCANFYPSRGEHWRVPYTTHLIVHQRYRCNI